MLGYLTLILLCQLVGESLTTVFDLPLPGPVLGMVLLFLLLLIRGEVPEGLETASGGLLRAMSLLFVPAGTGVILHVQLLSTTLLPLSAALVISTVVTILVTGLMMRWLGRAATDG